MITLNDLKTECNAGGTILRLDQSIDFKGTCESLTSVGKIKEFKYAPNAESQVLGAKDNKSIWMLIEELETGDKDWISLNNWLDQNNKGIFKNKTESNDSTKQDDTENLPF